MKGCESKREKQKKRGEIAKRVESCFMPNVALFPQIYLFSEACLRVQEATFAP